MVRVTTTFFLYTSKLWYVTCKPVGLEEKECGIVWRVTCKPVGLEENECGIVW